jgi:hypothetical protein
MVGELPKQHVAVVPDVYFSSTLTVGEPWMLERIPSDLVSSSGLSKLNILSRENLSKLDIGPTRKPDKT